MKDAFVVSYFAKCSKGGILKTMRNPFTKHTALLTTISIVFFFIYLFLYIGLPAGHGLLPQTGGENPPHLIFNQPDESINYLFTRAFALDGQFAISLGFDQKVSLDQIHPRSTTVVDNNLVPIGFPGINVLFGSVLAFLTMLFGAVSFNVFAVSLIPFLAAISPLLLYGIVRRVFDRRIAFVSSLLMYATPAWWYYASRPFQHNTLFVFLLLLGLFFFARALGQDQKMRMFTCFWSGVGFSLALYVRPSEFVWVSVLVIALLIATRNKWRGSDIVMGFFGVVIVALLFFATQTAYYGHPLGSGYVVPVQGSAGLITDGPQDISILKAVLLPFGFDFKYVAVHVYFYLVKFIWVWFGLALVGFVLFVSKKEETFTQKKKWYAGLYTAIAFYILVFYGSWSFFDNLAGIASFASSHARYFLPVYIGALPFVAFLLLYLYEKRKHAVSSVALIVLCGGLVYQSYTTVFNSYEGLRQVKTTVNEYYSYQDKLSELVGDGTIVTRYGDKYIFPLWDVVPGFLEEGEYIEQRFFTVKNLLDVGKDVYWYDLEVGPGDSAMFKFNSRLWEAELRLSEPIAAWDNLELRKIEKKL